MDIRNRAIESWQRLLDAYVDAQREIESLRPVDLVGNSAGGVWSLWYALARPERVDRLVLIGAPPLLPGARIPPPLRLMAAPGIGELSNRLMTPSPKMVEQIMGAFGEGDTIGRHPSSSRRWSRQETTSSPQPPTSPRPEQF